MADNTELQQELARATRQIGGGQARITRQVELVRQLKAEGHDTTQAQELLASVAAKC
jgi:arginine repressor